MMTMMEKKLVSGKGTLRAIRSMPSAMVRPTLVEATMN